MAPVPRHKRPGRRNAVTPTHATEARRPRGDSIRKIRDEVVRCERCARLRDYCAHVARTKRRAYRDDVYWGRPVPGFGDRRARLWIVGLAPAAHGANRTGRMFTGDSSGDWLFAALHQHGFATQPESTSRDDGQALHDAYVSAAVRCAPPGNKPTPEEIDACRPFLERELPALRRLRVVLCLGQIAFTATLRLLSGAGFEIPRPRPRFAHAAHYELRTPDEARREIILLASYHPSRQNTQTRKLTRRMWNAAFRRARRLLDS
ncbi:MAG: uracil-DNA glycosylase [Candidatus Latescibacterota bacterium]|nr:MAG: uracil-DNA glycosylase [Candidatus Latescibacterota bacterium]